MSYMFGGGPEHLAAYKVALAQVKAETGWKPKAYGPQPFDLYELYSRARARYRSQNRGLAKKAAPKKAASPYKPSYRPGFAPVKKVTTKKAAPRKRAYSPRPKFEGALHSCAGLAQDPCEVAPNCYWKPKNQTCATRSGAKAINLFRNPARQALLSSPALHRAQGHQQGGYWF